MTTQYFKILLVFVYLAIIHKLKIEKIFLPWKARHGKY